MSAITAGGEPDRPRNHPPAFTPCPRPWGFWATLAWLVAAWTVGSIAAAGLYFMWEGPSLRAGSLASEVALYVFELVVVIGFVAAARLARWPVRQYLALVRPRRADVLPVVACGIVLTALDWFLTDVLGLAAEDHRLWLGLYRAAASDGRLALFWFDTVMVGPFLEEIMFRGFLYRGWSHSRLGTTGTIVLTSILFAAMHAHYSWAGIFSCFYFGLVCGWLRWRSGTVLAPALLHSICNLGSMVQVAIDVHWS